MFLVKQLDEKPSYMAFRDLDTAYDRVDVETMCEEFVMEERSCSYSEICQTNIKGSVRMNKKVKLCQ